MNFKTKIKTLPLSLQTTICVFVISAYLLSCHEQINKADLRKQTLKPIDKISVLADSIYLSDWIREMKVDKDFMVIFDNKQETSYWLDIERNLQKILPYGKGPGEPFKVNQAMVKDDLVYVPNWAQKCYQIFSKKGEWRGSLHPPYIASDIAFALDDNMHFYTSYPNSEEKPIVVSDTASNIVRQFGEFAPSENEMHKRNINQRHLVLLGNGELLSIWYAKPLIERYSSKGELLERFDMSEFFAFNTRRIEELVEEMPHIRLRTRFTYYYDIDFFDNTLYLLYKGDYPEHRGDQVLTIKCGEEGLHMENDLTLGVERGFFNQICVSGNLLYAYDAASADIYIFDMNASAEI